MGDERGSSLAEAIVAVAIVCLAVGAAVTVAIPALHRLVPDAESTALAHAAQNELAAAIDITKYDGSTLVPNVVTTTVPLSGASALTATLTLAVSPDGDARDIEVTAAAADGSASAHVDATIAARAPQPGSTIAPGIAVAAPTGAP